MSKLSQNVFHLPKSERRARHICQKQVAPCAPRLIVNRKAPAPSGVGIFKRDNASKAPRSPSTALAAPISAKHSDSHSHHCRAMPRHAAAP